MSYQTVRQHGTFQALTPRPLVADNATLNGALPAPSEESDQLQIKRNDNHIHRQRRVVSYSAPIS